MYLDQESLGTTLYTVDIRQHSEIKLQYLPRYQSGASAQRLDCEQFAAEVLRSLHVCPKVCRLSTVFTRTTSGSGSGECLIVLSYERQYRMSAMPDRYFQQVRRLRKMRQSLHQGDSDSKGDPMRSQGHFLRQSKCFSSASPLIVLQPACLHIRASIGLASIQ